MGISLAAKTKLSLAEYFRILGMNPLHYEQVQLAGNGGPNMQRVACSSAVFQSNWRQADRVSRDEIALAIARAEADLEAFLGYRLLPDWEYDEWHELARPNRKELINLGQINRRGYQQAVQLDWRKFVVGGQRAATAIAEEIAIAWSDEDLDGYEETGTVTVATVVEDECEIRLFYPGHDGDPEWEIRPVNVSIINNIATITFRRELAVSELLLFALPNSDGQMPVANGLDDADFLAVVDVYRIYNDPSQQAMLMWEQILPEWSRCGCPACQFSIQSGCLHTRGDRDLSHVAWTTAEWDADEYAFKGTYLEFCRTPDAIRTWYLAGHQKRGMRCSKHIMDPDWARTVAYYATSMLERPMCDCSADTYDYWRSDLAVIGGTGVDVAFSPAQGNLNNPLGTRRGAIHAWNRLNRPDVKMTGGVLV